MRVQMSSEGWPKIFHLIFQRAPGEALFIINQLRKTLGNRKPIQKRAKTNEYVVKLAERKKKIFEFLVYEQHVLHQKNKKFRPASTEQVTEESPPPGTKQSRKVQVGQYEVKLDRIEKLSDKFSDFQDSDFGDDMVVRPWEMKYKKTEKPKKNTDLDEELRRVQEEYSPTIYRSNATPKWSFDNQPERAHQKVKSLHRQLNKSGNATNLFQQTLAKSLAK